MIPVQPYLPWKAITLVLSSSSVSITILHVVAALSSVLRVEHRRRTRRLWWDDYASIVPGVFECFTIAIIWLRLRHFDESEHSQYLKVAFSYMNMTSLCFVTWWSRISLALAVVRITPVWSKSRLWVIGFTCAFIISWIVFALAMTVTCAVNTAWQHLIADILICGPSSKITLATVPANVIGDMILVGFPLYRLWSINLQPAQRRLVLFVFSTSILTLLGSVSVAIVAYDKFFNGPGALFVWLMTTNIEQLVSVIACNLPVLISWGYRVSSRDDDDEPSDYITPHWSHVAPDTLSKPNFVLASLSGSRSQNIDDIVQVSTSEVSLHSQIRTQREESANEERKSTEDAPNTVSRKRTIV